MKNKILYLLPLLVLFAGSCTTPNVTPPATALVPQGTYTGQFTLAHLDSKTGMLDTSKKANLMLNMETATGFKVTGDTATVHAGSYGGYIVTTSTGQVQFFDKTYPPTGTPAKIHLDGIYDYTYDGTTLKIAAFGPLDTLEYFYKFTKTGN